MSKSVELGRRIYGTEIGAQNAPVKDIPWIGQEINVSSDTKLEQDTGTGKPIILRVFTFAANPERFKDHVPTRQELFDDHRDPIRQFLWKDDLVAVETLAPRIIVSQDKKSYQIFVACQPRAGRVLLERPQTLSKIANDPADNSR